MHNSIGAIESSSTSRLRSGRLNEAFWVLIRCLFEKAFSREIKKWNLGWTEASLFLISCMLEEVESLRGTYAGDTELDGWGCASKNSGCSKMASSDTIEAVAVFNVCHDFTLNCFKRLRHNQISDIIFLSIYVTS